MKEKSKNLSPSLAEELLTIHRMGIVLFFSLFGFFVAFNMFEWRYWLLVAPEAYYMLHVEFFVIMPIRMRENRQNKHPPSDAFRDFSSCPELTPKSLVKSFLKNLRDFDHLFYGHFKYSLGEKGSDSIEQIDEEYRKDKQKWEEERIDLLAKLNAATASSRLYRELLHDIVS